MPADSDSVGADEQAATRVARLAERVRRLDTKPGLIRASQRVRRMLPGDERYGDPLSTAGDEPTQVVGARIAELTAERPSTLRELGLGAVQVWQALSEAQGRGQGDREMTILFTDLVDFSTWALEAGDTLAVDLLREVGLAIEPAVTSNEGRVVKRLGDGLMAVFDEPAPAVAAAHDARRSLAGIDVSGHQPELRAGIHLGRPRRLGGDYLGVDVNIAARVMQNAKAGEVLVSDAAAERLDHDALSLKRRRRFQGKGTPDDIKVYSVEPA